MRLYKTLSTHLRGIDKTQTTGRSDIAPQAPAMPNYHYNNGFALQIAATWRSP